MVKFAYNNDKNASIGHISFEPNYGYHLQIYFKKDLNFYSKLKSVEKQSFKLQNLMAAYQQNLYHTQKLQK